MRNGIKKKTIISLLVFLFLASVIFPACPVGYTNEMAIIYDSNITTNITNVAISIDLNTSNITNFSANCTNILFQNNYRNETLKYSIDGNSSAYCRNASINATYWVLMPILYNSTGYSTTINNTIWVCTGNTGVYSEDKSMWADANASSVFHKIIGEPAYGNFSINSRGAGNSINKTACNKLQDCNEFDASSANYDLYNDTYLMNWNESFTISMWINMSGFSTNGHTVFYEQYGNTVNDTNQRTLFVYFGTTNTIYFYKKTDIIGGNQIQRIQHQITPIQGTGWFHLTGVYGGGSEDDIMIYLNSTASSNSPALSNWGDSATGYTMIGDDMQSGDTDYLLNGQITELQIYHGNKSQNYIKTMYAGHVSSYGAVTTSSSDTSAPYVTSIDISPLTPNPSSIIQCNITALDNESSPMDIYINWFLNGANQTAYARSANITNNTASLINLSLNTSITGVGDNWSCGAYGMAGTNASAIVYSLNVTISSAPPNAPTIYTPINTLYNITSLININYSNATTVYPLQQVQISLYQADGTFVKNISQNNSNYLNFTYDTSNETAGVYYIKINATDNQSITNESFSPVFLLYAFNKSYNPYSSDFMLSNNSYHFNRTSSITSMTANLLYNGTSKTITTSTSATDINFTSSFYPATSALNTTEYNLNWSFSFITANGTFYLNDSYTMNVTPVVLALCNASINMTSIIYSFYDSETLLSTNASILISYLLQLPDGTTKSIALPQATNNSVYVCIYPPYAEINTITPAEYVSATGYGSFTTARAFYASNVSQNITIYLDNSTDGTYYTFKVQNVYSSDIQGANIIGYRLLANGSYVQFQNSTTDSTGSVVFFLKTAHPYNFSISASGYNSINFNFIPASITNVLIQLTQNSTLNITKFTAWNDTQYYISPPSGYYNSTQILNFTIVSTTSNLSSWGMNVIKNNASGSFEIFNFSDTTSAGGSASFSMTPNATYIVYAWFQKLGNANYSIMPVYYYITNQTTGLALIREQMKINPITHEAFLSGWTFYFIALLFSVGAGIYLFQFGSGASAIGGLAVLCFFTYLAPSDMYLFGSYPVGVTPLIATITISIAVLAALYATTYGV